MTVTVTDRQWDAVRASVRATAERFCDLVSSVPDPGAEASAGWSVADVTAHLAVIAVLDAMPLPGAEPVSAMPGLAGAIARTTVDTVHEFNDLVLSHFRERDTGRLAEMIRDRVELTLTASRSHDPDEKYPWLGGSQVSLAGMFAHMINELMIHGNDIARAVRAPWPMPAQDAALFFDLFLAPVAGGTKGVLISGSKRPVDRRIAVEFQSGYTAPVTFVVRDGQAWTEPPGPGADVTIRFDPATLNLMLFGRISKARAVLTRKIVISGPRPWLLPAFLRTVRCPS